jgi:hypothetical protein
MMFELPQSFRDERWAAFERALSSWLETPDGRFAIYWAARERRDVDALRAAAPALTEALDDGVRG